METQHQNDVSKHTSHCGPLVSARSLVAYWAKPPFHSVPALQLQTASPAQFTSRLWDLLMTCLVCICLVLPGAVKVSSQLSEHGPFLPADGAVVWGSVGDSDVAGICDVLWAIGCKPMSEMQPWGAKLQKNKACRQSLIEAAHRVRTSNCHKLSVYACHDTWCSNAANTVGSNSWTDQILLLGTLPIIYLWRWISSVARSFTQFGKLYLPGLAVSWSVLRHRLPGESSTVTVCSTLAKPSTLCTLTTWKIDEDWLKCR
jgi:hypothetical protein